MSNFDGVIFRFAKKKHKAIFNVLELSLYYLKLVCDYKYTFFGEISVQKWP